MRGVIPGGMTNGMTGVVSSQPSGRLTDQRRAIGKAAVNEWENMEAPMPINRRTARKNRDEPPPGVTAASPVTITRRDGTTVTEPPQAPGRSVRTFEKPEPPGGSGRLEWEQKVDSAAGIGFMVARRGDYHARVDPKDDGWRWVVWTSYGRVAHGVAPTSRLATRAVEELLLQR